MNAPPGYVVWFFTNQYGVDPNCGNKDFLALYDGVYDATPTIYCPTSPGTQVSSSNTLVAEFSSDAGPNGAGLNATIRFYGDAFCCLLFVVCCCSLLFVAFAWFVCVCLFCSVLFH